MSLLIYQNVLLKMHRISHLVFFFHCNGTASTFLSWTWQCFKLVFGKCVFSTCRSCIYPEWYKHCNDVRRKCYHIFTPKMERFTVKGEKTVLRSLQRAFPHLVFQAQPKHRNRPKPSIVYIIDNLDKLSTNTLFITLLQKCLYMKIIPNMFMYRNICIWGK